MLPRSLHAVAGAPSCGAQENTGHSGRDDRQEKSEPKTHTQNRRVGHPAEEEHRKRELSIGDFTEDGGAMCAGGGGEIGGALVEGFVGEQGEGVGFFGRFGNAKLGRSENLNATGFVKGIHVRRIVFCVDMHCGCQQSEQKRVVSAPTGDDELIDFCLREDEAIEGINNGESGEDCGSAD